MGVEYFHVEAGVPTTTNYTTGSFDTMKTVMMLYHQPGIIL